MSDKDEEIKELKERLEKLEESNPKEQKKEKAEPGCLSQIFALLFIVIVVSYFLYDDSETSSSDSAQQAKPQKISPTQTQITQVIDLLKSENSEVLDALYNDGGAYNWVVAVNGTGNWMGYSSTMCSTLYEVGILGEDIAHESTIDHRMRVVNLNKFIETDGHFRKSSLGSTDCKTWKMNKI
tara:strand:+ start:75 stop:620 length:546 start_codon:yes stop_codon:yes gene_type:complete